MELQRSLEDELATDNQNVFVTSFRSEFMTGFGSWSNEIVESSVSEFLFFMITTFVIPLTIANVLVSVISNTFERVNAIQDILSMRVTCKLCLNMEYFILGLNSLFKCRTTHRQDHGTYFFVAIYDNHDDQNEGITELYQKMDNDKNSDVAEVDGQLNEMMKKHREMVDIKNKQSKGIFDAIDKLKTG